MATTHICTHFTQNTWKKDLCSNCFKSKSEHKEASSGGISSGAARMNSTKLMANGQNSLVKKMENFDYPNVNRMPMKSIMRRTKLKAKTCRVSFPKNLSEVIGYGGERSDNSDDDQDDFMNLDNDGDDMMEKRLSNGDDDDDGDGDDDEESLELRRLTKVNTDFNMHNGNFLGDPAENIKKTFAALKLGTPQVDKEGKKRTLQINVTPFGSMTDVKQTSSSSSSSSLSSVMAKNKFELKVPDVKGGIEKDSKGTGIKSTMPPPIVSSSNKTNECRPSTIRSNSDGTDSPPIEMAMEKSLLDEISETLEQKQNQKNPPSSNKAAGSGETSPSDGRLMATPRKIKFEITSLAESMENKTFLDIKKSIVRNAPIAKDQTKPKVNVVFNKYSDTESIGSDNENAVSAYYDDVVESQISYENIPDGKYVRKAMSKGKKAKKEPPSSVYATSQYLTDVLLSSKTRAASYNLNGAGGGDGGDGVSGNFMTSKILSDGLIVAKCTSDDALDSTNSSFDGSSDEEASYNMIRSESDSGIGISLNNDCKPLSIAEKNDKRSQEKANGPGEKGKNDAANGGDSNNSDYEVIKVVNHKSITMMKEDDITEKSRELHGEPDGSADPDGRLEQTQETNDAQKPPALPKTAPPTKMIDPRPSFLHGIPSASTSTSASASASSSSSSIASLKKPDLPTKPLVTSQTPLKSFVAIKRPERQQQQQMLNQLEVVTMKSNNDNNNNLNNANESTKDDLKLKKSKAPDPPQTPPTTTSLSHDNKMPTMPSEIKQSEKDLVSGNGDYGRQVATVRGKLPSVGKGNFVGSNCGTVSKAMAAQVLKEKDKAESRNTLNAKFRSLNTFATQRKNAIKNLELQNAEPLPIPRKVQPLPELSFKNPKSLSISEECLADATAASSTPSTPSTPLTPLGNSMSTINLSAATAAVSGDKKSPNKNKTKFSIKKFLRMGTTKVSDNLNNSSKIVKESIYSEICTGEEPNVSGKPRLVIIHPIDINPTAVEVVKDITKTGETIASPVSMAVSMAAKPPAPPLRSTDGQRAQEINKPARPPPPKSAELRRKQQIASATSSTAHLHSPNSPPTADSSVTSVNSLGAATSDTIKSKSDNVYANLGEIRSSIAPRKPERTASMREREAQLELARKRQMDGSINDSYDSISICSSLNGGDNALGTPHKMNKTTNACKNVSNNGMKVVDGKPPSGNSNTSYRIGNSYERKRNEAKISLSNKLEIFDTSCAYSVELGKTNESSVDGSGCTSSLKDSVRKITSTIDNYLKDKRDYENLYECVKSPLSPIANRSTETRFNPQPMNKRNNISTDSISMASYTRSEYGPVRNCLANVPRLTSASYCGSETGDTDIYSPYSYYGSEAGGDVTSDFNDSIWGIPSAEKNRKKAVNRLRMRKGRSVVHKSIEDNYSAVVGANHEALAQVLEQLQQTPIVPFALRPLANAINLRFEDFSILEGSHAFVVGKKAFHSAIWVTTPVTLALSADCNQLSGVGGELNQLSGGISGALNPITEFCDLVPSYHLPLMPSTEISLLQATISVLPRLQLDTLQSIGSILKDKYQVLNKSNYNFRGSIPNLVVLKENNATSMRNGTSVQNLATLNEEAADKINEKLNCDDCNCNVSNKNCGLSAFDDVMTREVAFIMLQLINGMKNLQVKGIEEMPLSLSNVVLAKEIDNKDAQARLCVLQCNYNHEEDDSMGTLCKCAYIALNDLLPITKITSTVGEILKQERSESLSKSKSVLEFILWGPADVSLAGTTKERELALQRWLDLERATVLHGLVRTRVELTVYDECHLMFLVRSSAKIMNDAAKLLEQQTNTNATLYTTTNHPVAK